MIVKKRMPIIVRDEGEAQAGVTVEAGLLERIDGNATVAADPHLGGTSAADHTVTLQGDTEATVHHLPKGILEQVPRAVGVVTASFKSGGEEGGEDGERQVVGVHHLHALISLGESAIVEVHAGFYMQTTTTLMELLLVTQAEEGDGMGPGVVVVVVGHLLGGQMRVPGQDRIGILPQKRKRRMTQRRFWKIKGHTKLRDLQQRTTVMTLMLT